MMLWEDGALTPKSWYLHSTGDLHVVLGSTRGSRNPSLEAGAPLLLITPNAPRGDYPDPAAPGSAGLDNLVPTEGVFLPEDTGGPGCCQGPLGFLRLGLWMREENSPPGQEELALTGGRREACPVGARRGPPPAISFPTATLHARCGDLNLRRVSARDTEFLGAGHTC